MKGRVRVVSNPPAVGGATVALQEESYEPQTLCGVTCCTRCSHDTAERLLPSQLQQPLPVAALGIAASLLAQLNVVEDRGATHGSAAPVSDPHLY